MARSLLPRPAGVLEVICARTAGHIWDSLRLPLQNLELGSVSVFVKHRYMDLYDTKARKFSAFVFFHCVINAVTQEMSI